MDEITLLFLLRGIYRTSEGATYTFGEAAPMADPASGCFVRQIPPLPVTLAIRHFLR